MPARSKWDVRLNAYIYLCVWHSKEAELSDENGDTDWEHLFPTANQCLRNESLKGSDEKIKAE